ncbi:MAG: CHAT domain-containing protein [Pyrinomonadaceae bacterium]|nr:CHAT domain-containing protein [Pyrinomonadaceae bacterium]
MAEPKDGADKEPPVSDVVKMQAVLKQLNSATKQKTAALYTLIGEKKFYVFLIASEGKVKVFDSSINKQDFNEKLIQLYVLLQKSAYDPRILSEELYKIIFPQKLEDELKKEKIETLMWQLDGNLRYIPVAALWDGEKYLVEKYQNIVLTRADSQRLLEKTQPVWTGVGFGTAEDQQIDLLKDKHTIEFRGLFGVREELSNIFITDKRDQGILKGEVYADKNFTKDKFYEALKKRRQVVHISSHFRFYEGDSALSFLVLGNGKALTLNEMKEQKGLFEGVELLTLSACETGAVLPNADGREIDGFAELAQRLGANAVMATLWQVPEFSTSDLMTKFYSNKQKGKMNKAKALRLAQLGLIRGTIQSKTKNGAEENLKGDESRKDTYLKIYNKIDKKYRPFYEPPPGTSYAHPYYWAPFILFGNWR